jgi:beta-galactosidase GanA
MPANLQMMYEAGIRWVRVDFSWSGIESPRGNWNFAHIDKVVEETEKTGLSISALLLYNVAWANPLTNILIFG